MFRENKRFSSADGRILINLTGISRFKILKEISNNKLYREFQVDYKNFTNDTTNIYNDIDADSMIEKVKFF